MTGRIVVDSERCKGCGLCVNACPGNCLEFSRESNKKGYFPSKVKLSGCTGCACCALVCPDAAISVYRESNIQEIRLHHRRTATLLKENA